MNCPRVWDGVAYSRRLHPISVSVYQSLTPLSTCNMELTADDTINNLDWVEIQTPDGKTEYYRVANVSTDMATGVNTVYMEHGACVLGDIMIPEITQDVTAGTDSASSHGANLVEYPENKSGTVAYMLGYILGKQGNNAKWAVGDVDATDTIYMELGNYTLLDCLSSMMQYIPGYQMEFVQNSASDWRVNIKQRPTAVSCEGRLSRNLQSCEVSYSTANICTRVYVDGVAHDADTISTYGVHAESMTLNDNLTTAQKNAIISSYLSNHCHPTVSIDISAIELSQITGLNIDKFELGTVCRIAVPWLDVVENEIIIDKRYADCYNSPEEVAITLANATPDLAIAMAAITSTAGGAGTGKGGVAGRQKQKEKEYKRFETHFEQTDEYFRLLATDTDWSDMKSGKIGSYTQLVINSQTFQTVVSNERAQTTSQITQTADSVTSLVIGTTASDIFIGDGNNGTEKGKKYKVKTRDAQGNPLTWEAYEPVQSQIEQLAGEITLTVSKTTFENTLKGYLKIAPDSAGIGVIAVDDKGHKITSAEIINAINGDKTSSTTIHADHIFLDAAKTVKVSDVLFIAQGGNFWVKRNATFGSKAGEFVTVNGGTVNAPTLQVNSGGDLKFAGSSQSESVVTIDRAKAADLITGVQIAGPTDNVYTLQYQKVGTGNTWNNASVTFSRATTLVGGFVSGEGASQTRNFWKSGSVKVVADPQGNEFLSTVSAPSGWGHWGNPSENPQENANTYYGKIGYTIGNETTVHETGATFAVNATSFLSGLTISGAGSQTTEGSTDGTFTASVYNGSTLVKSQDFTMRHVLAKVTIKDQTTGDNNPYVRARTNYISSSGTTYQYMYTDYSISNSISPTVNTANATVKGAVTTKIGGTTMLTSTETIGYVRASVSSGSKSDEMTITSALRSKASGTADAYGIAKTTVALAPSSVTNNPARMLVGAAVGSSSYATLPIDLSGTASIAPGSSSVVKAKVGNTEYASFTVTASAAPAMSLASISIPDATDSQHPMAKSGDKLVCYPFYRLGDQSTGQYWPSAIDVGTIVVNATANTITTATGSSTVTVTVGGVEVASKTINANVPSSGGYGAATLHYSQDAVNYSQFNTADDWAPEKSVTLNQDGKTVWGYLAVQQSGRNTQFASFKATISTSGGTYTKVANSYYYYGAPVKYNDSTDQYEYIHGDSGNYYWYCLSYNAGAIYVP